MNVIRETISLEERLAYLAEEKVLSMDAMDVLLDLMIFAIGINSIEDERTILESVAEKVQALVSFRSMAFYLVDEDDLYFKCAFCDPPEREVELEKERNVLVEDMTFAWALRRRRSVIVFSRDGKSQILLHVMMTPDRIVGMFMGELRENQTDMPDLALDFLSLLLLYCSAILESLRLKRNIQGLNDKLREKVLCLESSERELRRHRDFLEDEVAVRTRELAWRANHDALTGLADRQVFCQKLQSAIAEASLTGESIGILFLDLDHFKKINDTYGHEVGDHVLKRVAERLRSQVRGEDTVARLGGDEYTIFVPRVTDRSQVEAVAGRILRETEYPLVVDEISLFVTVSIGISLYPRDGVDCRELLRKADGAMYAAKRRKRGSYSFYDGGICVAKERSLSKEI